MAELGPSAKVVLLRSGDLSMDLRVPLRAAFTLESKPRHVGWTLSPHLAVDLRRGGWDLGVYTGPVLADRRYLATFYDVPAAYATPTRPAYRTGAGSSWPARRAASATCGWALTPSSMTSRVPRSTAARSCVAAARCRTASGCRGCSRTRRSG
jgi:hypothetical protein